MDKQKKSLTRRELRGPKHCFCPVCHEQATLLVDLDNEMLAETDNAGNRQYFCPQCNKTFSVASSYILLCK